MNRFPGHNGSNEPIFGRGIILTARSLALAHMVGGNKDSCGCVDANIFNHHNISNVQDHVPRYFL